MWHRGYNVDLTDAEAKLKKVEFFEREQELFHSHATTEMSRRIRRALRWLTRALQVREGETQFLNLAIALESVFTPPSADYKIGALLSDCVSKVASWENPKEVQRLVKALYGRRSGIMHQGSISQFIREIEHAHFIVVQCLGELLKASDHLSSYDDMLQRLGLNLEDYREDRFAEIGTESVSAETEPHHPFSWFCPWSLFWRR